MPDRQSKSNYTIDRRIPGAFEGETITRRRLMVGAANGAGIAATAAIILPALGFAVAPIFKNQTLPWQTVGVPGDFPIDNYVPKTITLNPSIGEAGKTTVYMRGRNPLLDTDKATKYNQFVAISTRCAHLGCPVRWVDASQRFICPCHGGVYNFVGAPTGGPPVRPLDRFYTRIENGFVQVGPRYSVNSRLRIFSPRDPAEPLDGIGQYLYPSRPGVRANPNGGN